MRPAELTNPTHTTYRVFFLKGVLHIQQTEKTWAEPQELTGYHEVACVLLNKHGFHCTDSSPTKLVDKTDTQYAQNLVGEAKTVLGALEDLKDKMFEAIYQADESRVIKMRLVSHNGVRIDALMLTKQGEIRDLRGNWCKEFSLFLAQTTGIRSNADGDALVFADFPQSVLSKPMTGEGSSIEVAFKSLAALIVAEAQAYTTAKQAMQVRIPRRMFVKSMTKQHLFCNFQNSSSRLSLV